MYPHLMTLKQIERVSWDCTTKDRGKYFNRLLEIALEQDIELQRLLEDNEELNNKIALLEKKVSYLEESIEEQESGKVGTQNSL